MSAIGSIRAVLGAAALTLVAALVVAWPRETFADRDAASDEVTTDGTKVSDVVVLGEIARDPTSKTGWVVTVDAENHGLKEATADVETNITCQIANRAARVGPVPKVMWTQKERFTVAAGSKVTRRYAVPSALAVKIAAAARADADYIKQLASDHPKYAGRMTRFAVDFRGPWADDYWTKPDNFSAGPYGDTMPDVPREMPIALPPPAL